MTEKLQYKIKHCKINKKLNQSFDHKSISTKLRLKTEPMPARRKKAWKAINMLKIKKYKKQTLAIFHFNSIEEIDKSITILNNYIINVIENTVSWVKS